MRAPTLVLETVYFIKALFIFLIIDYYKNYLVFQNVNKVFMKV